MRAGASAFRSWFLAALGSCLSAGIAAAAESAEADRGPEFSWDETATEAFLDAIVIVETDGRWNAIGSLGERGGFQFTRRTWDEFSLGIPFWFAHDPRMSREVARRALATIQRRLRYHGLAADPWHCAAAWNSGVAAVARQRLGRVQRAYAQRVLNLTLLHLRSAEPAPVLVKQTPVPVITIASVETVPEPVAAAVAEPEPTVRFVYNDER